MAFRPASRENQSSSGGILDSQPQRTSRPNSSGRRGLGPRNNEATLTPDKPVLGLAGGSDALRRIMRQLTRDSMADKDLVEMEAEDEFMYDELDSDSDVDPDETDDKSKTKEKEVDGHGHMHNGRYLSCRRYPWICLKSNCTHKKHFAGEYKAASGKNVKASQDKDGSLQQT